LKISHISVSNSVLEFLSTHESRLVAPNVLEGSIFKQTLEFLTSISHDLIGDLLMESALNVNVVASSICEMAAH